MTGKKNGSDGGPAGKSGRDMDGRVRGGHLKNPPYLPVFFMLAAITVLELYASSFGLDRAVLVTFLLLLAGTKASLVAMYYMHLRYESAALKMLMVDPFVLGVAFALVMMV